MKKDKEYINELETKLFKLNNELANVKEDNARLIREDKDWRNNYYTLSNEKIKLQNRLSHLLESNFIASFDDIDLISREYKRNISEADKINKEWGEYKHLSYRTKMTVNEVYGSRCINDLTEDMKNCKITCCSAEELKPAISEISTTRPCVVRKDGDWRFAKCKFHRWVDLEKLTTTGGSVIETHALVEMPDGTMAYPKPEHIRFVDNK